MSKTKTARRNRYAVVLLCALALLGAAAFGIPSVYAAGETSLVSAETEQTLEFRETYIEGERLTVPAAKFVSGADSAPATGVLTYPDGKATVSAEVALDQTGDYTLSYGGVLGGRFVSRDFTFFVCGAVAKVGENSTLSVGTPPAYVGSDDVGLNVKLAENETLDFLQTIDLNDPKWKSEPLIELLITPSTFGIADFNEMIMTLADVENPEKSVRFRITRSGRLTCAFGAADGQLFTSYEAAWWGKEEKIFVQTNWGACLWCSFTGEYERATREGTSRPIQMKDQFLSVKYNVDTKQIYFDECSVASADGTPVRKDLFIIDLDDPKYFNELFTGLPSNRVRLSISATRYAATTANFFVRKVGDLDLTSLARPRSQAVIEVEDDYAESMPTAKVGAAYTVPKATAFDPMYDNAVCPVEIEVWNNYGASAAKRIPVTDGTFTPQVAGTYHILYKARSTTGHVSEFACTVKACEEVDALDITVTPAEEKRTAVAGEPYTIELEHIEQTLGNGYMQSVSVKATRGDRVIELDVEDPTFTPDTVGTYTISYAVTDGIGQTATDAYELVVTAPETLQFPEPPAMPKTLVSGRRYRVPEVYATDFASEKTLATMTVKDDEGEKTYNAGDAYIPVVRESGNVAITFSAGNGVLPYEIPCVTPFYAEGGSLRLDMSQYLVGDVETRLQSQSVSIAATAPNSGWTFANKLLVSGFCVNLTFDPQTSNFDAVTLTLTDSRDPEISVSASVERRVENHAIATYLKTGNRTVPIGNLFVGDTPCSLRLQYDNGYWTNGNWRVRAFDGDEPFAGFTSDFVYMDMAFENAATDESAVYGVDTVNDQQISSVPRDRTEPKIVLRGTYGGLNAIDSDVTLAAALAADVLDPEISFVLTVTDPDGNPVTDTQGEVLLLVDPTREYTVHLTRFGSYRVRYVATDASGNARQFMYNVNVADVAAPHLSFTGTLPETVEAGGTVTVPDVAVTDDVSAAENITVYRYVSTPSGKTVVLSGDTVSLVTNDVGIYRITVMAIDEAGNTAVATLTVQVG